MTEQNKAGELWAVHAQGPDEIYPAFSKADAEQHAAELNALPMPYGISVNAVAIPSPWPAAEHWEHLAEEEREHKEQIMARAAQPAPVVPEVLRIQFCKLGRLGAAFDPADTRYAYTYAEQPDNVGAMKLGRAALSVKHGGDEIDAGLSLLDRLSREGFGVFQIDAAPAQMAPDVCETCDGHGVVTRRSGQTPETYEEWNEDCPDCAAPAQGQQVGCQECERYRAVLEGACYPLAPGFHDLSIEQVRHIGTTVADMTKTIIAERDQLRAELSALKAQQAEQKPVEAVHLGWDYLDDRTKVATYFVRCPGDKAPRLYTAPQPAPAQDVVGLSVPALTEQEAEDLFEFHEAVCCDAGHRVEKDGMRRLSEIGAVESVGFGRHRLTEFGTYLLAALADHDKQSGEKKS